MADQMDNTPRLFVSQQGSVTNEHFSWNGIQKQVHVVVKNLAFQIELESNIDLTKSNLSGKLLYDFDREEDPKLEVSYVKAEPLEYKVNLLDNGNKAIVETKIKVLTSQHEDMLFRVQFAAIDPATLIPVEAYSKPIKVISKLTQLKKKEIAAASPGLSTSGTHTTSKKRQSSGGSAPVVATPAPVQSAALTSPIVPDGFAAVLSRMEQQQQHHHNLLTAISKKLFGVEEVQFQSIDNSNNNQQYQNIAVNAIPVPVVDAALVNQATEELERATEEAARSAELDNLFKKFLTNLSNVPIDERPLKIQGLIGGLGVQEMETLNELFTNLQEIHVAKKIKTDHIVANDQMVSSDQVVSNS